MLSAKEANSGVFSSLFTAAASPAATRSERWLKEQVRRAKREGVFTMTVELTPELAELLLRNNPDNRKISPKIASYANDISAGRWLHNGQTIIVAETGELNDGQHRCYGVIEAGRSIITEITFGVGRETRSTIDSGIKRTTGQQMAMLGKTDCNNRAHAVNLILTYYRTGRFTKPSFELRPTQAEVMEWEQEHDLAKDILVGGACASKFRISAGLAAALHWFLSSVDPSGASYFFGALKAGTASGGTLAASSPIFKLRERLMDAKGRKTKLTDTEIAGLFFTAWNAFRANRSVRSLKFDPASPLPQPV